LEQERDRGVIHAEGVSVFVGWEEATLSTPQACGLQFHHPREGAHS